MSDGIDIQGGLLTRDFMERLRIGDVPGAKPADYIVPGRLEDAVTAAWGQLRNAWSQFHIKKARVQPGDREEAYRVTRDDWLKFVFDVLRYGYLTEQRALTIEGKVYPIKFSFNGVPIEVVGYDQDLDEGPGGTARGNPHSQLQEYLNRTKSDAWGILTNGHVWRIMRNNASTRPAYIEFNLQSVMEKFDEFAIWWRLAHASRISGDKPWLESWMLEADRQGTRALDDLRKGVEQAIEILGAGFLKHPRNKALHQRLESEALAAQDYYHQVLRLVYRLIFLFVTEDRGILLDPKASAEAKDLFTSNFGTKRLRRIAHEAKGNQHHDQFEALKVVMNGLKDARGCPPLGIVGLNGSLWSKEFIPDLEGASIRNVHFLRAIRRLTRIQREKGPVQMVDYQRLASEELGSIYESLLELEAEVHPQDRTFKLAFSKGNERRTTGSYYTSTDLIDLVLDHALDPLLDEAQKKANPEQALLELTVCDPTCGSGHFLIAAGHRIAHRLAQARTGEYEPGLNEKRRALRDVVGHCIYGVDINPLSVELAKVGLWLEAMEPGRPLTFLDHHIKCGNALMGAFPDFLEKGIPTQAYTPRAGIDNKETCRELVRLNKLLPMDQARLTSFRADAIRVQNVLSEALARIDAMPDETVGQILEKEAEYERGYRQTDEYTRFKQALDAWCSAFTYAKVGIAAEANLTNGQLIDFLHPDGAHAIEILKLIRDETAKPGNRFLHWPLEFPRVFARGGFDAVIGNPPYMGGRNLGSELGRHYSQFFEAVYPGYLGKSDLAGASIRLFHRITRKAGNAGLVTTFAVASGATRESGLRQVVKTGAIRAAFTGIPWSGDANVVVSIIIIGNQAMQMRNLNGESVEYISSRLDRLPENEISPLAPRQRMCFEGHKPAGEGFVLSRQEAKELLERDSRNHEVVKPFLTATDLLQEPSRAPTRYAICFGDRSLVEAQAYPLPFEVVEKTVKPVRAKATTEIWRTYWWRFGKYNEAIRPENVGTPHVIVRARHTETPLFILVPRDILVSDTCSIFPTDDPLLLGLLNSGIHEVWYRKEGSGLKQDSRYTPRTCFETFPLQANSKGIPEMGTSFHEAVLRAADSRGIALSPLWGLVNSPASKEADIEKIRSLRNELTEAVAVGFGMTGIDFRFGFYEDQARRSRYAMHPEAAEQVYLALVELNGKQAAGASHPRPSQLKQTAVGLQNLVGPKQVRL